MIRGADRVGDAGVQAVSCVDECVGGGYVWIRPESDCPGLSTLVGGVDHGGGGFVDSELVEFEDFDASAVVGEDVCCCADGAH